MPDQAPPLGSTTPPETATSSTSTTTKTATETTEKVNQGAFMSDLHVNASGLVLFLATGIGIFWPDYKPKCDAVAAAAATYLFASSKAKN